jgi:hypothetical protein
MTSNIEVITISIPSAKSMNVMATINEQRINDERNAKRERIESIGWSEIPCFINFIKDSIENATKQGRKDISFSFTDCYFNSSDERVKYRFKGMCTHEMCQYVKDIFEKCGYDAYIYKLSTTCGRPYRNGAVEISWNNI